jgi:hypothetical protein
VRQQLPVQILLIHYQKYDTSGSELVIFDISQLVIFALEYDIPKRRSSRLVGPC